MRVHVADMKLIVVIMIGLSVALFSAGRSIAAFTDRAPTAAAAHHHGADHHHGHDHGQAHGKDLAAAHGDETDHDGSSDPRADGSCGSACCTSACHAVATLVPVMPFVPAFMSTALDPQDAPELCGDAPPGFDRPPRTA